VRIDNDPFGSGELFGVSVGNFWLERCVSGGTTFIGSTKEVKTKLSLFCMQLVSSEPIQSTIIGICLLTVIGTSNINRLQNFFLAASSMVFLRIENKENKQKDGKK